MTVLLVVGGVGLILLVATLMFDVTESLFESLDIGIGPDGLFSTPVIGAFLTAFGFGAAAAMRALPTGIAVLAGLGGGTVMAAGTFFATRAVMRMPTDPTPRAAELVGRTGTVLIAVPAAGFGTVRVSYLGQPHQLSARSASPIAAGAQVVVVEVLSATAVLVTAIDF